MESNVAELPLSHKLWAWFETNKKQTLWGASAIVVLGLIAWFVVWQRDRRELTASEALSVASMPQPGTTTRSLAEAYMKVAEKYPNSRAASRALVLAAASLFVDGKFPEARVKFEQFTREHRDSQFMGEALLGVAACLDAEGKTNEAVAAYTDIKDHHPGENTVSQAKFALARIYEDQNKPEQALNLFEDINRNEPYSSIGSEAGIRAEELKQKHPALAMVVSPTNSPPMKLQKR